MQAGKRLFAAHGYEQTATSAIASEARTSESQLMRYFGGKVGLLQALFDAAWVDINGRVKRAFDVNRTARDTILDVFQTMSAVLARDPDLATLFLFEARRLRGGKPRIHVSEGFGAFVDMIRGVVKKAQAAREIDRSLDTGAVTSALVGAAEAMFRDRLITKAAGGRPFAEREMRRTLDAMLSGFAPGQPRTRRRVATSRLRAAR
jgi:AcrR family transcriptional regulator